MGSGKDSAANFLAAKYKGDRVAFSDPIYDIMHFAQRRCGIPRSKDRQFLQFVGTEWARAKDPDVWVTSLLRRTAYCTRPIFLSDIRYPNELRALQDNGWVCVKLFGRRDVLRSGTGDSHHVSETSVDTIPTSCWDLVLDNSGTLDDFYTQLDNVNWSMLSLRP